MSVSIVARLLGVVLCFVGASEARAFSSSTRFAAPFSGAETGAWGGAGGRWFTGSPGDGYTCAVCHGEEPAPIEISGIPERFEPGATYTIDVSWPAEDIGAFVLELVDDDGRPAGSLNVVDDAEETRCPTDAPATQVWPVGEREVLLTEACGARRTRLEWTAPTTGVGARLFFAGVVGNRSGDPTGDATRVESWGIARVGAPAVEAGSVGCAAGGRPGTALWLVVGLLGWRRRRIVLRSGAGSGSGSGSGSASGTASGTASGFGYCLGLDGSGDGHAHAHVDVDVDVDVHVDADVDVDVHAHVDVDADADARVGVRCGRALAVVLLVGVWPGVVLAEDTISATFFVRADTDQTTVVSPELAASLRVGDRTTVRAGYTVDIWTSASIDVRTAATRAIREQRDEINAGVAHELDDVTLGVDYRFSHEPDYVAHGGGLFASYRFADGNATLSARLAFAQDIVSRSGDDAFERRLGTFGGLLTFTQNIDPRTLVQLAYELVRREGYQSSPYRFVGIGADGRCNMAAALCVPETHPTQRTRNAFVLRAKRAFGEHWSFGLDYRFYIDDWALRGNTLLGTLGLIPKERSLVTLRYRFHHQTGASFYSPAYGGDLSTIPRFVTRDRELSPLHSHRLAIAWEQGIDLSDAGPELRITLALGGSTFRYFDFVGLERVFALDVTLAAVVVL